MRSPLAANATTDGVVRAPSALGITFTSAAEDAPTPSTTATHEFVVPRSIPTILPMMGQTIYQTRARKRIPLVPEGTGTNRTLRRDDVSSRRTRLRANPSRR